MRIALEFEKKGPAKYISHLDLQRAFSRAIRRSGLPVRLSKGFNPHYKVSFASALALGIESDSEYVEIETEDISPEIFLKAMAKALPPGLIAKRAATLSEGMPKLAAAVREAEYKVFFQPVHIDGIKAAVYDIMDSSEIIIQKRSKSGIKETDIKSMIIDLEAGDGYLLMRLSAAPSGSLKPGIVVDKIKERAGDFSCRIVRTGLFTYRAGKAVELLSAF